MKLGVGVFQIAKNAYLFLNDRAGKFFTLAWKPMSISFGANFIAGVLLSLFSLPKWAALATLPIDLLASSLFVLACHRFVLLGWNSDTDHIPLRLAHREQRFLAVTAVTWALLFPQMLMGYVGVSGSGAIGEFLLDNMILVLLSPFLLLVLLPRFVYALPAIAEDQPNAVSYGVRLGRGVWIKTIFALILVGLPIQLIAMIAKKLAASPYFALIVAGEVAQIVFSFLQAALAVVVVCDIYRRRQPQESA
jgi:hypothetical protein